ncbi:tail length tape measure protein [Caudoviricetes sp.]|nr:tail length tape measure protein [Caudoviricetes sp.]
MPSADELSVLVTADTTAFQQAMDGVIKRLDSLQSSSDKTADATEGLAMRTAIATTAMGLAVEAIGAVISKLGAWANEAWNTADALGDLSVKLSVSVEELQKFQYAATLSGSSAQGAASLIQGMQMKIGAAAQGSEEARQKFEELGINFDKLKKQNPAEQAAQLADAIASIKDPTEQSAKAMEVFGRGARENLAFIKQGGDNMRELGAEAEKVGAVLSQLDISRIQAANDAFDSMHQVLMTAMGDMEGDLAPAFQVFAELMRDTVIPGLKAIAEGFVQILADTYPLGINLGVLADAFNLLWHIAEAAVLPIAASFLYLSGHTEEAEEKLNQAADALLKVGTEAGKYQMKMEDLTKATVKHTEVVAEDTDGILKNARAYMESQKFEDDVFAIKKARIVRMQEELDRERQARLDREKFDKDLLDRDTKMQLDKLQQDANIIKAREDMRAKADAAMASFQAYGDKSGSKYRGKEGEETKYDKQLGQEGLDTEAKKIEEQKAFDKANEDIAEASRNKAFATESDYRAAKEEAERIHKQNLADIDQESADARANIEQQRMDAALNLTGKALGDLATLMESGNKKAFEVGKAAAIAQTIISTWQGAQAAFTGMVSTIPGPAGIAAGVAAASAAVVAGMVRVQNISQTKFGGGGGGSAGGGSAGGGGGSGGQAAPPPPRETNVNVTLVGERFSEQQVRSLVGAINNAAGDNVNLTTKAA